MVAFAMPVLTEAGRQSRRHPHVVATFGPRMRPTDLRKALDHEVEARTFLPAPLLDVVEEGRQVGRVPVPHPDLILAREELDGSLTHDFKQPEEWFPARTGRAANQTLVRKPGQRANHVTAGVGADRFDDMQRNRPAEHTEPDEQRPFRPGRSEEHTSELQSLAYL